LRCRDLFIVMLNVVAPSRVDSFAKLASVKLGQGEALQLISRSVSDDEKVLETRKQGDRGI